MDNEKMTVDNTDSRSGKRGGYLKEGTTVSVPLWKASNGGKTQSRFGLELGQRGGWLINESGVAVETIGGVG